MARWPNELPQTLPLKHSDQPFIESDRLRDDMDQGPAFMRPTNSSPVRRIPGIEMPMTTAQKQSFETFVRTTLGNGSDAFDWQDPIPGMGDVKCQLGEEIPSARPASHDLWIVSFTLEVLP